MEGLMKLFAYLDPGTGSLVMQAIIGGAVAVGVVLKAYWHKIAKLFGRTDKKEKKDLRDEE
jgi:hypothetical protein